MTGKKPYVIRLDNVDVSNIIYYLFQYENGGDQFNEFTKIPEPARSKVKKLTADFYQIIQNIDFSEAVFANDLKIEDGNKVLVKLLEAKSKKYSLISQKQTSDITLEEFLRWMKEE